MVAQLVINSDEAGRLAVENDYQAVLGRGSDPGGLAAWLQVYHDDNPPVVGGLASSPESTTSLASKAAKAGFS